MNLHLMLLLHIASREKTVSGIYSGIEYDSDSGKYTNVLVGIDSNVQTDTFFFNSLKILLSEFSKALYVATENRAQISEIVIELPAGGKQEYYESVSYFFDERPLLQKGFCTCISISTYINIGWVTHHGLYLGR